MIVSKKYLAYMQSVTISGNVTFTVNVREVYGQQHSGT